MTETRPNHFRRLRENRRHRAVLIAAAVLLLAGSGVVVTGALGPGRTRSRAASTLEVGPAPTSSTVTVAASSTTTTTSTTVAPAPAGSVAAGADPAADPPPNPSPACAYGGCVTLDAADPLGPADHAGNGFNELPVGQLNSGALEQLGPAPMYRSIPGYEGSGRFDWTAWDEAVAAGAKTTLILSDLWTAQSGQQYPPTPWSNWDAYNSWVKQTVVEIVASGQPVDYWDVYNEPGWVNYYSPANFAAETPQDLLEQFLYTYQDIKSVDPSAAIVGPSIGWVAFSPISPSSPEWQITHEPDITTFLDFCAQHDLHLALVAWHENGAQPSTIVAWAQQIKALINSLPALGDPPMYLDEYAAAPDEPVPGWDIGWLAAISSGGFAYTVRSCWDGCSPATLDGLLAAGGATAPEWFDRLTYAHMQGQAIAVSSSSPALPAIGSVSGQQVVALIGRMAGCGSPEAWCRQWPYPWFGPVPAESVQVSVVVPWSSPKVTIDLSYEYSDPGAALAAPLSASPADVHLSPDGTGREQLTFVIPSFVDGDAYNLTVTAG